MKIIKNNFKFDLIKGIEWSLHIISYWIVLLLVSLMFKSFYIDYGCFGFYSLISVIIIYILNLTVKPILFFLTLPITGLTLGLFYPFINVIILKMTDFIMGNKFDINDMFIAFFIAVFISVLNILISEIFLKPIIRRIKKNG
ncbi:MAG: phage holin family protein [Bacilli bacterium]|nr:phage holin family protein [Bacilli bacterium]